MWNDSIRLGVLLMVLSACTTGERWVAYYNDKAAMEEFAPYDTLVLDSRYHPELAQLKRDGRVILAYLSLGEIREDEALYEELKEQRYLLDENDAWESHIVDIRYPLWYDHIVKERVPEILDKGFDGLMLDTVDSPLTYEKDDPERYDGMADAAVYMIKAIRYHHPESSIMLNRGFEIVPRVSDELDMILAESIYADYDMDNDTAEPFPSHIYEAIVQQLKEFQASNQNLKIYTLDYWPRDDDMNIEQIYKIHRGHGFIPYVTTPDLTTIHSEPSASKKEQAPSTKEGNGHA